LLSTFQTVTLAASFFPQAYAYNEKISAGRSDGGFPLYAQDSGSPTVFIPSGCLLQL
jgi:hypothetical protein